MWSCRCHCRSLYDDKIEFPALHFKTLPSLFQIIRATKNIDILIQLNLSGFYAKLDSLIDHFARVQLKVGGGEKMLDSNLYGPLAAFEGVWESQLGDDIAPADDRGVENNKYRERMEFTPIGQVNNHEQALYGVKYITKAWRHGEPDAFHEDSGYWLWDKDRKQLMKCFVVPRGITIIAGGTIDPTAKSFTLKATRGSTSYGICANEFLEQEFQTREFNISIEMLSAKSFRYEQDTQIVMKGQTKVFHHTDKNTLTRIS